MPASKSLFDERLDGIRFGDAGGAADLSLVPEYHEGALHQNVQLTQRVLLRIKIHVEDGEILEGGFFGECGDNQFLRPTAWAVGNFASIVLVSSPAGDTSSVRPGSSGLIEHRSPAARGGICRSTPVKLGGCGSRGYSIVIIGRHLLCDLRLSPR
jgi:hypothetical protein